MRLQASYGSAGGEEGGAAEEEEEAEEEEDSTVRPHHQVHLSSERLCAIKIFLQGASEHRHVFAAVRGVIVTCFRRPHPRLVLFLGVRLSERLGALLGALERKRVRE
jgi:hypothetical protein